MARNKASRRCWPVAYQIHLPSTCLRMFVSRRGFDPNDADSLCTTTFATTQPSSMTQRKCRHCGRHDFQSDGGLTKHKRHHCPLRPRATPGPARSTRAAAAEAPPSRPAVRHASAPRTVAFAAQELDPFLMQTPQCDNDPPTPRPGPSTRSLGSPESESESESTSQPEPIGCDVRGVRLGPGIHPAPGTTAPIPLPSALHPDPLVLDPSLQENIVGSFKTWEGFRWAVHHVLEAQNSDMEESQLRNLIQRIANNPDLDLPSAQSIRKQLLASPLALPTTTTFFEDKQKRPYVFIHRVLNAAIDDLVGRAYLADGIKLSAEVEIRSMPEGGFERYYSDLNRGDAWADAQIRIGNDGVLMLPIILSSDKSRVRFVHVPFIFFIFFIVSRHMLVAHRSKTVALSGQFISQLPYTPRKIAVGQPCMHTFSLVTCSSPTRSTATLGNLASRPPSTRTSSRNS